MEIYVKTGQNVAGRAALEADSKMESGAQEVYGGALLRTTSVEGKGGRIEGTWNHEAANPRGRDAALK